MADGEISMNAKKRDELSKGQLNQLRRDGFIPCVLYGHKVKPTSLVVELKEFISALKQSNIINITLDKKNDATKVLIKEIQYDYLSTSIIHADFQQIKAGEKISVEIPIELTGEPEGIHHGGRLDQVLHQMKIESLPKHLPDKLIVDVSSLNLDESLSIADIIFPAGVKAVNLDAGTVVAAVVPIKMTDEETDKEVVASTEGSSQEPEVIAKGKKEEEED